ncbi:unnamed protein product [Rotaria socialis]|uniref:Uncharacterized protein n=2 Tax=Rotaria socialis TaxID=392032 RepID=A0A821TJH9_9BILA|nr:unnamed protein product [Rotaria socialis]
MDKFIRQLTHNNEVFEKQWPEIYTNINKATTSVGAKSVLNALVEYVIVEPRDPPPSQMKLVLIQNVIKQLVNEKLPVILDDVIEAFTSVLAAHITDDWHVNFLAAIYQEFCLGASLYSIPSNSHLIERIFKSLQKKKEVMMVMRIAYQDLYRYTMLHSCESSAWPPMVSSLRYSLSRLYDNNDTSTDAQLDLSTLLLDDATSDNVHLLATSFENDIELLKSNYTKVLETVERLILMDRFDDASRFTYKPIIKHIASIDHAPLIQMMIRLCSFLANTTERRDQLCSNILYHNTYALLSVKANKKLSSLFSDLILAMLEMYTMDTPGYAAKLLTKSEFYPWAELTYHIGHLIRICGSYDSFVHTDYFSKLDPLQDILKLISDRAKINPIIYRATHEPVLKYILRWSVKNTVYSMHVYKMGGQILDLIDKQQATFDTCSQFIDTLRHRVSGDEDNDDPEQARLRNAQFFQPLSARLAKFMEQFKTLPSALHQKLALFFMAILNRPLYAENGIRKFEYWTMNNIWHYVSLCIANQEDVRLYNTCLDRLYTRAQDDNDQDLKCWWISFWQTVGMKFPQVAADHVEQFLCITIDEKDMSFLVLLPVSDLKR